MEPIIKAEVNDLSNRFEKRAANRKTTEKNNCANSNLTAFFIF
jgi:hypothetical protein